MVEILAAGFALASLTLLVFAVLALINPAWTGFSTRKKAVPLYLLATVGTFVLTGVVISSATESTDAPRAQAVSSTAGEARGELRPLQDLLTEFSSLTDARQKNWATEETWRHWVNGTCTVSEVSYTSTFSEIDDSLLEVACELPSGDRAVLFYQQGKEKEVLAFNKGDVLDFEGRLKTIRDWGFWSSGYVLVK